MSRTTFNRNDSVRLYPISRKRGIVTRFPRSSEFRNHVIECFEKAKQQFPEHRSRLAELDRIPIVFFAKGRTAGWAKYSPYLNIEFNASLIQNDWDQMVNSTIPHEVAHIVDYLIYGNSDGHGARWRRIAIALGDVNAGKRTHDMKTVRARKTRKMKYVASCGTEIWVTINMHKKIQRGQVRVIHRTKGRITHEHCKWMEKVVG